MRLAAPVRVQVPAKVNLHLGVGALREDGYHDLVNLFQAVDLYDRILARPGSGISLEHSGEGEGEVPLDAANLAWRAAELLAEHVNLPTDVHLEIDKQIPVAGGMAGGSADAAAALLACATLWNTRISKAELAELAASLGADVPFALLGGTALGLGKGEQLTPVLSTAALHWVFATQDFGISAGAAYRELDRLREEGVACEPAGSVDELLDALRAGDAVRVGAALANDLQPACFSLAPELERTIEAGLDRGALGAIVSGSGPTCAFLVSGPDAAEEMASALIRGGVCRDARIADGPVHGARIVGA